jgi:hypothetical protein
VRLFYGANLHGATASYDTGDRTFNAGSMDQSLLGVNTPMQTTILFDAVQDSDATWVGPVAGGGSGPTVLTVTSSGDGQRRRWRCHRSRAT